MRTGEQKDKGIGGQVNMRTGEYEDRRTRG